MSQPKDQPTCISIIACDAVYRDDQTKKLIIAGAFNQIVSSGFPCKHDRMHVLFTLTNCNGTYQLSLSIVQEKTDHKIVEVKGPIQVTNPLLIQDYNIGIQGVVFPEPGKYWIVVEADGVPLQMRPIHVLEMEKTSHATIGD